MNVFNWDEYEDTPEEEAIRTFDSKEEAGFDWDKYEDADPKMAQTSLIGSFQKGLQESTSGKLTQTYLGRPEEALQDESLGSSLVSSVGAIGGDMPFYLIGGAIGALLGSVGGPLGMALGGMFGTFALPAFMKQSIEEYQRYAQDGNDLTFGEFIKSADRIGSRTLNEGAFGVILGSLGKGMDTLVKIPMFKNMFNAKYVGKPVEQTAKAITTGTVATVVGGAAEGRVPTGKEFAHNILLAGGFEFANAAPELLEQAQNAYLKSKTSPEKFWKSRTAQKLKDKLIDEGLPRTSRETQETALKELQQFEKAQPTIEAPKSELKGIKPEAPETTKSLDLGERRISDRTQRLKQETPEARKQIQQTGDIISRESFSSDTKAGREIQKNIKVESAKEKTSVSKKYKIAETTYKNEADIFDGLVSALEGRLAKIEVTLEKSPGQKKAVTVIENLLSELTQDGGFIEVPLERLIKTSDSIGSTLNYETTEPDARNILKPVVTEINEAAIDSLRRKNIDPKVLVEADAAYSEWAGKYINDEIHPYLGKREVKPEELYRLSKKEKQYRSIEEALPEGKEKTTLLSKLARDIIEERLNPYYGKPEKVGSRAYEREIENVKDLIGTTPENKAKVEQVDAYLRKSAEVKPGRPKTSQEKTISETKKPEAAIPLKPQKVTAYTKKIKSVAKWMGKTPEDLARKMNTRTGIREVIEDLSKTKNGKKISESLVKEKVRDIFEEGKISKDSTGEDVLKLLNDQKTYGLLEELMGKEDTKILYDVAKKMGTKGFTSKAFWWAMKALRIPVQYGSGYTIFRLLSKVLGLGTHEDRED